MSKEIDNQVVQMTFDNKQFEKNAAQTISTIDKLKMSLQFKGVSEGLKEVSKAIASFPVKSIGNAADVVTNKFSLMGTAVDQLIRNTERRLEAFAMNAVNTLNIFKGGLTAGFSEYETQINAVQTIWANTRDAGTQMGDITRVLDELNEYADKTIYNFSEMTRNIGTFTAAGVGLEESATAIQGIANLAAVSGSTSQQAATAMYQLSQALSAGKVNLMDWNSVVNAGMGGKMFRDVLAETAEELGTINSQFAKGLKDGSINFRETLTKEGWITSEVLTAALTKFTDTSTELGRMATDAATKVKTFTQLLDTLKESVQSGWTQSWEYIIGDFESARNLFTELSNKLQSLIQPSMDARNKMLAYWSGANKANEEAEKNLKAQEKHQNEIEALAKRVIANEFGVGQARYDALDALGYDHREVQNAVQHMLGLADAFVIEAEAAEESDKSTKKSFDQMSGREHVLAGLVNIGNALGEVLHFVKLAFTDVFPPITGAKLVYISQKFHEFTETLDLNRDQLKKMRFALNGLFSIFKIGGKVLNGVLKGVINVFSSILPSSKSFLNTVGEIGTSIKSLSDELNVETITENTEKFLYDVGNFFKQITNNIENLYHAIKEINPEALTTSFIEFIRSFRDIWKPIGETTEISKHAVNAIDELKQGLGNIASSKIDLSWVRKIADEFVGLSETIGVFELISELNPVKILSRIMHAINNFLENLSIDDMKIASLIYFFYQMGKLTKQLRLLTQGFMSLPTALNNLANTLRISVENLTKTADKYLKAQRFKSIATAILILTGALTVIILDIFWISKIIEKDWKTAVYGMVAVGAIFAALIVAVKIFDKVEGISLSVTATLIGLTIAIGNIATAIGVLGSMNETTLQRGGIVVSIIAGALTIIAVLLGILNRHATSIDRSGKALVKFSIAVNLLILPILALSLMTMEGSKLNVPGALGVISVLGLIYGMVIGLMSLFTTSSDLASASSAILAFSVAMNLLTIPIFVLSSLMEENDNVLAAVGVLAAMALAIAAVMSLISIFTAAGDLTASAIAFGILSLSLIAIAKAISMLAEIPTKKLIVATVAIGAIVAMLTIFIGIMVALTAALNTIGLGVLVPIIIGTLALLVGSFALLGFAIASVFDSLANFSDALIRFSNADFKNFGNNIKTITLGIKDNLDLMGDTFGEAIRKIAEVIKENAIPIATIIGSVFALIIQTLANVIVEMTPAIVELLNGLLNLVLQLVVVGVVDIVYWFVKGFFAGITAALTAAEEELPGLIDALNTFLNSLGDSLIENGEQIHEGCKKIMKGIQLCLFGEEFEAGFVTGMGVFLASVLGKVFSSDGELSWLAAGYGGLLAMWLSDGMNDSESEEKLNREAVAMGQKTTAALVSEIQKANDGVDAEGVIAGDRYISSLVKEMNKRCVDVYGEAQPLGEEMADGTIDGIGPKLPELKSEGDRAGNYLADGVSQGVTSGYYRTVQPAIDTMSSNMVNRLNTNLKISSPSKVGITAGRWWGTGVAIGVKESGEQAAAESGNMGQAIIDSITGIFEGTDIGKSLSGMFSGLGNIDEMLTGGGLLDGLKDKFSLDNLFDSMGLDTTITPIMDLSNVSSGISDINSMFGSQSLQLSDLNSSLTSSLDVGQLQNGSYDDAKIVASISNLDARMDALASAISSIQIRMDTGALVGSIAGPMDSALGKRAVYAGRGIR